MKALPETAWHGEDNSIPPSPEDFPGSASCAISNLGKLPNLERVVVQFACASMISKDNENINSCLQMFDHLDDESEAVEAEKRDAHRSLMVQSYHALALNPPSSIRHLELKHVAAFACSAWNDAAFRALLQGLTSFAISLRGGETTTDRRINVMSGYRKFISKLPTYVFNHLTNVRHFRFAATSGGPPGLDQPDVNSTVLPLLGKHMRLLQTVTVEHVFINTELADFIIAHASTLESIHLTHCFSAYDVNLYRQVGYSWGDLFSRIAAAPMVALRVFEIGQAHFEQDPPLYDNDWDHGNFTYANELRARAPGRRMWDYRELDDKYGALDTNAEASFDQFESGEDHRQWEKLEELIKRNVEASCEAANSM